MADKLSWTELRHAIAQRTGVSEKQVGSFLAALQEQLTEGLKKDKMVKINGLGTFKLQAVDHVVNVSSLGRSPSAVVIVEQTCIGISLVSKLECLEDELVTAETISG